MVEKYTSLVGEKFGRLTVLAFDHINKHRSTCWLCECDCGNRIVVSRNHLTTGNTKSCGCRERGPKREDIVGRRFGRLTVLDFDHIDSHRNSYWLCECDCGSHTIVTRGGLTSGNTTSCGCYQIEGIRARSTIHGMSRTVLYKVWGDMKNRCNDVNNIAYHRYGGRGITICDDWYNFKSFRDWALDNGYEPGLTLDRIDNNGDYCPENCRWVDRRTQGNNRENNHIVEYSGISHTISEWTDILGVCYSTLWARINRGDMRDFERYFNKYKEDI